MLRGQWFTSFYVIDAIWTAYNIHPIYKFKDKQINRSIDRQREIDRKRKMFLAENNSILQFKVDFKL